MRKGIKLQLPPSMDIQDVVAFASSHGCSVRSRGFYDLVMVPDEETTEKSRYERARKATDKTLGPETVPTGFKKVEPVDVEGDSTPPEGFTGACGYCGKDFTSHCVAVEHAFFGPVHIGCRDHLNFFKDSMQRNF